MDNRVRVTGIADIAAAVALVERYAASMPNDSGSRVCPLVCEELLLRLLNMGCNEIDVSVKGRAAGLVEISARGERADATETAGDGIDVQINGCLLEQYADSFSYRYKNGVNRYTVSARKRDAVDLTGEIYDFYKKADPQTPQKPTAVLWHIARNHKGFFAVSVCILDRKSVV